MDLSSTTAAWIAIAAAIVALAAVAIAVAAWLKLRRIRSSQLVLLGSGMFLAAASAGPSGAIVAALTPPALHGTAFAVLTLANNALGLAPGPIVTGWLADRIGLWGALQWLPFASMAAASA